MLALGACAAPDHPQAPSTPGQPGLACGAPSVIAQIRQGVRARGGPRLLGIGGVTETGFLGDPTVDQGWRWCLGQAALSDGTRREARWVIRRAAARAGSAGGLGFGWCIAGLGEPDCSRLAP